MLLSPFTHKPASAMKRPSLVSKAAPAAWPWLLAALLLALPLGTGCDSSGGAEEEPVPPGLRVTTVTTGHDLDADGYTLMINGSEEVTIGPNETVTLSQITSGSHQLDLAGVDANCAAESATASVTVTGPTEVTFEVGCTLKGRIAFRCSLGAGLFDLCVMRPDGSERIRLAPGQIQGTPSFSPDGSKIVFSQGTGVIYTIDAGGGEWTLLIQNLGLREAVQPSLSRDGSKIAFSARPIEVETGVYTGTRDIYVANADGANVVNLTNSNDLWYEAPTWSPDGTQLAFVGLSAPDENSIDDEWGDLYVLNADGTNLRNITAGTPQASLVGWGVPSWSPVDSRIAFTAAPSREDRYRIFGVYMIDANGASLTRLTNNQEQGAHASWRPDGEWLVFSGDAPDANPEGGYCDKGGTIAVMRPDGSEKQFITDCSLPSSHAEQSPSWSLGEGS